MLLETFAFITFIVVYPVTDPQRITLHAQVTRLHNDFETVGEQYQLTRNLIKQIPHLACKELGFIRCRNDEQQTVELPVCLDTWAGIDISHVSLLSLGDCNELLYNVLKSKI